MYPIPHTFTLPGKNFICIELSGPRSLQAMNPLYLGSHNICLLLLLKGQTTCGKKLETAAERKFSIRGLKNKVVL